MLVGVYRSREAWSWTRVPLRGVLALSELDALLHRLGERFSIGEHSVTDIGGNERKRQLADANRHGGPEPQASSERRTEVRAVVQDSPDPTHDGTKAPLNVLQYVAAGCENWVSPGCRLCCRNVACIVRHNNLL